MSLDLSALSAFTDENKMPLIRKAILGGKTLGLISLQPDIKTSAAINILEGSAVFQAGACGFNASGTTTLTQRLLTVKKIKQNEAICVDDLEAYWTQTMMKAGSFNEEIPFSQMYSEEKAARSAKALEKLVWQGDTTGSGNLAMVDGLIKIIDAESSVVTGTTKALDAANIVDAVDEMVAAIPEDVLEAEDLHLFMPMEKYKIYTKALRDANLFHYGDFADGDYLITIPGTNVKAIGVPGLNGTARIFLCEASNLFAGTDLLNEQEEFKIFYADEADEVRVIQKFKIGFQVAFAERIVSN
tara:strand:+ start:437 stop:1336 length:900 start_codon:yes stop_codon:yes gene_type:complete